jgi:hypothetical protein
MNNKIETTVKRVQESPSSVFTKEDVLNLLKAMEAPEEVKEEPVKKDLSPKEVKEKILAELKEKILEKFRAELEDAMDSDLVDFDSAEFSIGYDRRVEIDSIDVNKEDIIEILDQALDDLEIDEED